MKLNIGCGRDTRPGFINMDRHAWPGDSSHPAVDLVHDLEDAPWPFQDGSVDYILASHVLEHIFRFELVWSEIARILKPGALIEVRVPYGHNYDPYHIRYFDQSSIRRLTDKANPRSLETPSSSFVEVGHFVCAGFPWWHIEHYLGWHPPFGRKGHEMRFVLRKI